MISFARYLLTAGAATCVDVAIVQTMLSLDMAQQPLFFAIAIVPFYGWLVGKVRRSLLLPTIYGFMSIAFVLTAQVFQGETPDPMVARVFYVAISVMNLLLVSVFWSFMLEMLSSEQSKRLFGFIAAGGTLGALVGPGATALFVKSIGNDGVLYVGAGMYLLAVVLQRFLMIEWRRIAPEAAGVSCWCSWCMRWL